MLFDDLAGKASHRVTRAGCESTVHFRASWEKHTVYFKAQPLSGTQVLCDSNLTHIPREKEELPLVSASGCWALTHILSTHYH